MSQDQGPLYKLLKWVAICGGVAWISYEGYRHFAGMAPGDISYIDGNNLFKAGLYERAAGYFKTTLEADPRHAPALRALANSYVQLKRYDDALTAIERAIAIDPEFAGNIALRGIVYDHAGRHEQAIADYERSLKMDPEISKGMHWLDRLLYNVQETPPTINDRLEYLKGQMKLPASQRVLSMPELDGKQRPYER
ncbi:lipoprotein NlpI [bacterium BMS3Bbin10]|nr:lipoprotein NlpI [bacterium BMS3Bbin10]